MTTATMNADFEEAGRVQDLTESLKNMVNNVAGVEPGQGEEFVSIRPSTDMPEIDLRRAIDHFSK